MNFYYHPNPKENNTLSPEESGHLIKVLRGKPGTVFSILDGKGHSYQAEIVDPNSRKCTFKLIDENEAPPKSFHVHIAIAPTKSSDRLEWFIEKACELGADKISIILTQRTERTKVKIDRLEKKAIAAMKQSKNLWKCEIVGPLNFKDFVTQSETTGPKLAAYVETGLEHSLQSKIQPNTDVLILIGPEGDFSESEVELLKTMDFNLVSLGPSVLRTETAGVVAVHTINLVNQSNKVY